MPAGAVIGSVCSVTHQERRRAAQTRYPLPEVKRAPNAPPCASRELEGLRVQILHLSRARFAPVLSIRRSPRGTRRADSRMPARIRAARPVSGLHTAPRIASYYPDHDKPRPVRLRCRLRPLERLRRITLPHHMNHISPAPPVQTLLELMELARERPHQPRPPLAGANASALPMSSTSPRAFTLIRRR
jgi:hypothetical protein